MSDVVGNTKDRFSHAVAHKNKCFFLSVECMRITVGEISSIAARCKTGIFELKRYAVAIHVNLC